jgi:hypothetical protein
MSKNTKNQPDANPINIDVEIENAAQTGQKSVAAFAHLHSRVFRDAMKFNAELLDFARRRIGADIETSDRLTRCSSVTDAMGVMTDFCQNAFHDYADHTTSLVRVGTTITSQNAEETIAEATQVNDTD